MIDVKLKFEEPKTFTGIKELPMQNSYICSCCKKIKMERAF